MKKLRKFLLLAAVGVLGMSGGQITFAEEVAVGTQTESHPAETGELSSGALGTTQSDEKAGTQTAGFYEKKGYTYYQNVNGKNVTGWQKINGKYYYFLPKKTNGAPKGSMVTGLQNIDGKIFYFKVKDGSMVRKWMTVRNKRYYFTASGAPGVRGSAVTGWKKIGAYRYYFSKNGVLQTNRWISKKYYVDAQGRRLTDTVTPDGYVVDSNGRKQSLASGWVEKDGKVYYYKSGKKTVGWKTIKKKKYYFDEDGVRQDGWLNIKNYTYYLEDGVMQTGWTTVAKKQYYFKPNGRMAKDTVVEGITIGPDGVAEKIPRILIIAGHGQGDVGAYATYGKTTYYEYKYTREFASLIMKKLQASAGSAMQITMYDQDYDCFQVVSGRKEGPNPKFTNYDYVLEVHFDASGASTKDLKGDGKYKGVCMIVNVDKKKKDRKLDQAILDGILDTGFKQFAGGVLSDQQFLGYTLCNARTCQGLGVSYGLLETAFIDDRDDMKFYNTNKNKMAQAVADAICQYFA